DIESHVDTITKPVLGASELVFFNPAMFDAGPPLTALSYRLVVDELDGSASMTVLVDAISGKVLPRYANFVGAKNRTIRDANRAQTTSAPNCYTESGPVGTPDSECVAAFQNTGATYDYYLGTFNRDSFNNNGATMIAVVRYGTVAN